MHNLRPLLDISTNLSYSKLYDETTFYDQFIHDLNNCSSEIIIGSPFISTKRMSSLIPTFNKLIDKKIKIYVITRHPNQHNPEMRLESENEICWLESVGIQVFITSNYDHRKVAIIDRKILWEGSLNILSQTKSRELMRRINNTELTKDCFKFMNLGKYIN